MVDSESNPPVKIVVDLPSDEVGDVPSVSGENLRELSLTTHVTEEPEAVANHGKTNIEVLNDGVVPDTDANMSVIGGQETSEPEKNLNSDVKTGGQVSKTKTNVYKSYKASSGLGALMAQMRAQNKVNVPSGQKRPVDELKGTEEPPTKISKPQIEYTWVAKESKRNVLATDHLVQVVDDCFQTGTTPKFNFAANCPENNYVRSCRYSPDGKYLITDSEDRMFRVFSVGDDDRLTLKLGKCAGGLIYQTGWDPFSRFFGTTSTDSPIHIWNPDTGMQVASLRGINHLDCLEHAFAFDFDLNGQKVYASYSGNVKRFDLNRPGKQYNILKTYKKREGGQSAMLPALTFSPAMHGVFAVGSVQGSLGIYSDQTNMCDTFIQTGCNSVGLIKFSNDATKVYVGGSTGDSIEVYDIRFTTHCWIKYARAARTSQRVYFDLNSENTHLFSSSTDGHIHVFDLQKANQQNLDGSPTLPTITLANASRCSSTGLSLNPQRPTMATTHGQRVYPAPIVDGEAIFEGIDEADDYIMLKNKLDNSVKVWAL